MYVIFETPPPFWDFLFIYLFLNKFKKIIKKKKKKLPMVDLKKVTLPPPPQLYKMSNFQNSRPKKKKKVSSYPPPVIIKWNVKVHDTTKRLFFTNNLMKRESFRAKRGMGENEYRQGLSNNLLKR